MVSLKVIGTLIVIIQLITSLPVDENNCDKTNILCGKAYDHFVEHLCLDDKYSNCPMEKDNTMPELDHKVQVADECCQTGCKAGYLKIFYCKNFSSSTTEKYHKDGLPTLGSLYPPKENGMFWEVIISPLGFLFNRAPQEQQPPLEFQINNN